MLISAESLRVQPHCTAIQDNIRMKVAFIGVGNMGKPMAANLIKEGHQVTVLDSNTALATKVATEIGATACSRMSELANTDFIVTMLPDGKVVRSVALGEGGIASVARRGTIVLDMSSSQPLITRETGAALLTRGVILIDAPVSGGVERAVKGTLTIMIGADDPAALAKAKPILSCMGNTLFEVGKLGSGHAAKALNNVVGAGNYALLAEALIVAERYGINQETLVDIVNTSTGQSFISTVVMKKFVIPKTYNTGFKVGLLAKDAGIAAELSTELGCDTPFIGLTDERWARARDTLGAGEDHSKAIMLWREEGESR
jgi:3-hydroxyisobutyrate dehydrogenase